MAGKRVKAKNLGGGLAGSFLDMAKKFITGNPGAKAGKKVGGRLGTGLINMHKKKR